MSKNIKYNFKSVLFLGVGGVSMYQLALAFKSLGVKVYGYDAKKSAYTKVCEDNGIKVFHSFNKEICKVDLCVKTSAIKSGKFIDYLNKLNCPIVDRAEMLSWVCSKFKKVIAVAGTHGKSTTSSLIYEILKSAGKKVSCHIGADVANKRFNFGDDYIVVEACEYNKSFLSLYPTISVVTNVEAEHLDSYGSMFNLKAAFLTFLKRAETRFVFSEKSTKFLKKYKNINFVQKTTLQLSPKIKGEHNIKNISLAIAVCEKLGVDYNTIISAVNSFAGLPRRYEYIGKAKSIKIYIDYAHHPTEIEAFVDTFSREFKNNQIVFQPHTFSRTKLLLKDFINIFSKIENLTIYKEYSARENLVDGTSAKELYFEIKKINPNVIYCDSPKSVVKVLKEVDAVAFVGAGDINLVASKVLNILKHQERKIYN